jgi:DNA-binding MarR family transcriptional regulator
MRKTADTVSSASDARMEHFRPALSISHESMLIEGSDEFFRHVLFLSRMFADRLTIFRDVVAKQIGLSGNQYVILLAIAHSQGNGGVTVRDVSHYALMASTHVTTQVGALIRKGLVRKSPNQKDGRSVLLTLTPKGVKAMDQIAPMRREFNDAFFVNVSRTSLIAASKFLEQVTSNSENALGLLKQAEEGTFPEIFASAEN